MAIQFACPKCTASIRVPDAAAGKRGTCPKCATKLIVPQPEPPPVAIAPTAPPSPSTQPPSSGNFPTDLPLIAEAPAMAQVARRRAKRKGSNPLIPILLFCVIAGLVGYWMLKPGVTIEGELSAEKVPGFEIPAVSIDKATIPISMDDNGPTWEELVAHPPTNVKVPDVFQLRFEAGETGVKIRIQGVEGLDVFRVRTNALIRQFFELHADDISRQKQKQFGDAIKNFGTDWKTSKQNDLPFQTADYFDTVGLNRLTGVMGFCLSAQVGDKNYRCLHEDPEGRLYFLLPEDTSQFVLKGRKLPDGELLFESRLTVKVTETTTPPPAEKTSEPEVELEPLMESEPEPTTE